MCLAKDYAAECAGKYIAFEQKVENLMANGISEFDAFSMVLNGLCIR